MTQPTPDFALLNLNKPSGPTSHDVVDAVRRGTSQRKVGHAGTLDPMAEGVLILALGKATRLLEYLTASDKRYRATVRLGLTTDTYDLEGEVVERLSLPGDVTTESVGNLLSTRYTGQILQQPPIYSALKVGGKSAHARARAGEEVKLDPRPVTIYSIGLLAFDPPDLTLEVHCGPGTYVRSLAHDLGQALGCGAALAALTRLASGSFHVDGAVSLETFEAGFGDDTWRDHLLPADLALDGTPQVHLDEDGFSRVRNGQFLPAPDATGLARAYASDGRFIAVLQGQGDAWRPKKVFA